VDWLNPETWTLPAKLFGLWGNVASGAVAVFGLLGLIFTGIKKGWAPFGWLLRGRRQKQKPSPLAFVADDSQSRISRAQAGERVGSQAFARACRHLSQVSAQTRCSPARKLRAVFS
jgi:hypothetical protein